MQSRNLVLTVASVLLLFVLVAGGSWLMDRRRWNAHRAETACLSNTKRLAIAMRTYAADHDARLPSAATWCDDLLPNLNSGNDFICPLGPDARATYAMNRWLDEVQIQGLDPESPYDEAAGKIPDPASGEAVDPAEVVMIIEGPGGWNLSGGPEAVRYRHNDGANFGFADGHARWGRSDRVYEWRWPHKLASHPDNVQTQ